MTSFADWIKSLPTGAETTSWLNKCGLCNWEYTTEIQSGELKLLECPECGNTTLQMVRG